MTREKDDQKDVFRFTDEEWRDFFNAAFGSGRTNPPAMSPFEENQAKLPELPLPGEIPTEYLIVNSLWKTLSDEVGALNIFTKLPEDIEVIPSLTALEIRTEQTDAFPKYVNAFERILIPRPPLAIAFQKRTVEESTIACRLGLHTAEALVIEGFIDQVDKRTYTGIKALVEASQFRQDAWTTYYNDQKRNKLIGVVSIPKEADPERLDSLDPADFKMHHLLIPRVHPLRYFYVAGGLKLLIDRLQSSRNS